MRPRRLAAACCAAVLMALAGARLPAQRPARRGHVIGQVSTAGKLILMRLDAGALGRQNLFNLVGRTLRFTPAQGGYRVEDLPLRWDAILGAKLARPEVALEHFAFPFSGQDWRSLSVGVTGSIRFGPPRVAPGFGPPGFVPRDRGGISVARFAQLSAAAENLVNTAPAICVFFKPRMSGARYAKELDDRLVVTWDLTEPYGNIQDFSWFPTVNRFQAVLYKSGAIEMSYQQLAARDAIVGVYPLVPAGAPTVRATLTGPASNHAPANLDLRSLKVSLVGGILVRAELQTAGPVVPPGDAGLAGLSYRVHFRLPGAAGGPGSGADWTIYGFAPRNGAGGTPRYVAFGPGVERQVTVSGDTIAIEGMLPAALRRAPVISVSADSAGARSAAPVSRLAARRVALRGLHDPEVHFSALPPHAGPFPVVFEAFHYFALPNNRDLACTVIQALGDKFDFLAYYSDFRVDNQEAGTPSNGPLGTADGIPVTGIGAEQRGLASYCTAGRFQWGFIQPVYSGAIQMQAYPPADAPVGDARDITYYEKQLAENSPDRRMPPYLYAMSQLGHEMGHRWAAFVDAKVGGELISLGPVHWAMGLQARAPFPYVRPTEASIMGGGVWQANGDGTYTQLDDNYYVPASGYSYLDLYLMGLIAPSEVPDFFLLRHLVPVGRDALGHRIFKADRIRITIGDVIAAEGPRRPDVEHSQRRFNTGMVMIVQHGQQPSQRLIEETNGIRRQWIKYFSIATGHRASMTANPR